MGFFNGIRRILGTGAKASDSEPKNAAATGNSVEPSIHVVIDGALSIFPLAPFAVCSIGRSADNVIVIPAAEASRNHATIQRQTGNRCVLTDLRSRNGTNVNGRRIEEKVLENGDRITIGTCELLYHGPELFAGAAGPPLSDKTQFIVQNSLATVLVIDIREGGQLAVRTPMGAQNQPKSANADQHHRPGGGFGNA